MYKKSVIVFMILVITMMVTLSCGAAGNVSDQVVVIGQNGIYDLNAAVNALGRNAGNAVIYLNGSLNISQAVELPENLSGLKSITFASYTGSPVTVSMGGSVICANGVPVTLDQGVTLSNGFLVGGKCNNQYGTVSVKESVLIINGSADYVIGGGLAMAYGAVSSVKDVNIILNGNANYVHGGGYAFSGGTADVSGLAYIFQTAKSTVRNTLYAGGYASGSGSNAPVNSAHVISLGQTGKLMQNSGFAENGASAAIGTYSIELVNPKVVPTQQSYVPQPENNFYPMGGTTVMYVGPNQQARNFTDAVNLLPNNAGNVEFRIMGNFRQESDVVIPSNRGITSVTVTGNNNTRMTVSWPEDIGFFANGIPTTIANSVAFRDGVIYGGANVGAGQQSVLRSTYLDISGSVNKVVAGSKAKGAASSASVGSSTLIFRGKASAWIYAGGAALYGGYSSVDNASLSLMQGASVEQSISGGGYSFGAGSQSDVKDSYMDVSGSVIYAVYMGGYADQSGSAATTGQVYLNLQAAGNVGQSVWYGGRAYKNAYVTVDTAMAQISGRVGAMVHKEGRASDGGSVHIRVIR